MQLIIVESPKKAKTIERFLDGKYKVMGSGGHVRGLPEKRFAVDVDNNFEPTYVIEPKQEKLVKELKEMSAKADRVYLATDPDREGEAIAWHLYEVLEIKGKTHRIKFNEISEKAVKTALQTPGRIDYNLVDSQQARRILDRIVGYKLSPLVRTRVKNCESAGRVQSVAVKLAVELERKIQSFVPEEYWTITASLKPVDSQSKFKMLLAEKDGKKYRPSNQEEAEEVYNTVKNGEFVVKTVKSGVSKSKPLPPFTTSTMQQDASNKLGLSAPQVMQVAQHLYEGVETPKGHLALVTYIRTDSTRIAEDAQKECLEYVASKYGKEYCPSKPNVYTAKKNSQDAHEAIRPIDINVTPESVENILDKNHYNLYKLIYERYIASQMTSAEYNSMQVTAGCANYTFKASGKSVKFKGYTVAYEYDFAGKTDDGIENKLLPPLNVNDKLNLQKLDKEQKFTKAPVRYTDATLVKAIEENGIGRPSTYATIIGTLIRHKYISRKGKYLVPTEIAFEATDLLNKYFRDIMDVGFTAKMETQLDNIAEGNEDWRKIVGNFYTPFIKELKIATNDNNEPTDVPCDYCGTLLVKKKGRFGEFLVCPSCKKTKNPDDKVTEHKCPNCSSNMVLKDGRYGKYLSCTNAECNTKMQQGDELSQEKCSKCGGVMLLKTGKFGKYLKCTRCITTKSMSEYVGECPICHKPAQKMISKKGKVYYGCSGYPTCNFISWDAPTGELCPNCGKHLVTDKDGNVVCSDKNCNYTKTVKSKK
ncbi:MAG: type I DNA topoisomerase [Clostridia bacterium]|nr:type I DNA topoisomerase [Clostridia bacterium]